MALVALRCRTLTFNLSETLLGDDFRDEGSLRHHVTLAVICDNVPELLVLFAMVQLGYSMNVARFAAFAMGNMRLDSERKLAFEIGYQHCADAGRRLKQRDGGPTMHEAEHLGNAVGNGHAKSN